jgi:hypothetical protein
MTNENIYHVLEQAGYKYQVQGAGVFVPFDQQNKFTLATMHVFLQGAMPGVPYHLAECGAGLKVVML